MEKPEAISAEDDLGARSNSVSTIRQIVHDKSGFGHHHLGAEHGIYCRS